MTEQPDTIDPVEFLRSSAIKWQMHARQSFMLIEILRDDPHHSLDEIVSAQKCHAIESEVARERLWQYLDARTK